MKAMSGDLCKITPAAACPAFIPSLFQVSALGRQSGGGGREKNTENKAGSRDLLAAFVRVCPGCVGVCAWVCDLMERLFASPVRPELASRTHPCRGAYLLQPNALCKTRPVMATTTSGF